MIKIFYWGDYSDRNQAMKKINVIPGYEKVDRTMNYKRINNNSREKVRRGRKYPLYNILGLHLSSPLLDYQQSHQSN